tara:strand:- start:121 stop:1983 length:1863 start_codon:yes stop_codon:yes gene_type:complete
MALPEIRKTRAAQAKETAASEKNAQLNTVQTVLQTDIATFTRKTADSVQKMFDVQKNQLELDRLRAGKELEQQREEARKTVDKDQPLAEQFKDKFGFPIFGIGSMIAGISALAGAALGLRGWEADLLVSLDQFADYVTKPIRTGIANLGHAILRVFGFTRTGDIMRGYFSPLNIETRTYRQQLFDGIVNTFKSIIRIITKPFTLITNQLTKIPGSEKLSKTVSFFVTQISKAFGFFTSAASGVTKFLSSGIGKNLGQFFGSVGGVAKLFGTILKPIGFVFSIFDGVKTFMNTEGSLFTKLNEGIAAALGDFVGAPLDLLKTGLVWVADNLLGKDNFISKFLTSFSVEEVLKNIIATPGRILTGAFEKILEPLFKGEFKVVGDNIMKIFRKMINAVIGVFSSVANFVLEKLGIDFRFGEDEVSEKERKLNEIKEKKIQLENKEKKLREDLETGDYNVIQAQKKLAQVEEEYQEYLDGLADRGSVGQGYKIDRFERNIKSAEKNLAKEQAKVQEKINAIEEEKKKLLLAEKEALFDVKDFVSGSLTGNPSGNGAASAINQNLLGAGMGGYHKEGTAYIDQSNKPTIIKNENNNYGGNQRVEPVSRYGYNFDNINFAAGAYGG